MNFENLHAAVKNEIRRPDKDDSITRALRAVILQLHTTGYYSQDLVEDFLDVETPENLMKFPLPPRYREVDAIAPRTVTGLPIQISTNNNEYEKVSPSDLFTEGGNSLPDIYYISGGTFVLRSSVKPQRLYIRYWQFPEVSDLKLETFIMSSHPELIINGATARVFRQMRQKDAANDYQALFDGDFAQAVSTFITGN